MGTLLGKFTPQDVGALVVIVGTIVALCLGIETGTREILGVAVGWCFGRVVTSVTKNNTSANTSTDKRA